MSPTLLCRVMWCQYALRGRDIDFDNVVSFEYACNTGRRGRSCLTLTHILLPQPPHWRQSQDPTPVISVHLFLFDPQASIMYISTLVSPTLGFCAGLYVPNALLQMNLLEKPTQFTSEQILMPVWEPTHLWALLHVHHHPLMLFGNGQCGRMDPLIDHLPLSGLKCEEALSGVTHPAMRIRQLIACSHGNLSNCGWMHRPTYLIQTRFI